MFHSQKMMKMSKIFVAYINSDNEDQAEDDDIAQVESIRKESLPEEFISKSLNILTQFSQR